MCKKYQWSWHMQKANHFFKKNRDYLQKITYFLGICFLKHKHSHFSTYQTGVFSWQPHTFLQESVKQTEVWASQPPFWSIRPSSFLLYEMWWLFVVNNVILRQVRQPFGDYLTWNDTSWECLQRILKTRDPSEHTNLFF